jgi:alpha-glucosidase
MLADLVDVQELEARVAAWWRDAVIYQVYVRSFADSNGDGVGDIAGLIDHLDHLEWLGMDAVWCSPISVSPNADWGYDVTDYCAVDPALGTLDDVDRLVREAEQRGIRVVLDLVPNHTSIEHPWFVDARKSRTAPHRDWYVWADPAPDGGPPNNWLSSFVGSAWTLDPLTGQYYLHNFLAEQADLNWWNDDVRAEFDRILRFWFDRGIAGFRIDVAHMIVKDALLRDNPPTDEHDHWMDQLRGQRQVYNACQPATHDVFRRWRQIANGYDPPRLLLGETHIFDLAAVASFYGHDDELALAFNFRFVHEEFDAERLRTVVEDTYATLPSDAWPVWTLSNHDKSRFPTRWCLGDPARVRCALLLLAALRGTPVLYYGDELGLPDTDVPPDRIVDPVTKAFHGIVNRDAARTAMPWSSIPGGGFTEPGVEPWLPFGDLSAYTVAAQRDDPNSILRFVRDLLAVRRAEPDLREGDYVDAGSRADLWVFRRGARVVVAVNLGPDSHEIAIPGARGRVAIATDRARDDESISDHLALDGWSAAVVILGE